MQNIFFTELIAVDRHCGYAVLRFQLFYLALCLLTVRLFRIHQNQKRLSLLFQFRYRLFLRLQKILPRKLSKRAVTRHHQANRGMFGNHLFGADLRRLVERNRLLEPRRFYHPLLLILQISRCIRHKKAHTVDQAQANRFSFAELQLHGVFRHKFRLHRRDCLSFSAQRQGIPHLRPLFFRKLRQRQHLQKTADQGGLSRPHRSHHADQKLAVCSFLNITIYRICIHALLSPFGFRCYVLLYSMSRPSPISPQNALLCAQKRHCRPFRTRSAFSLSRYCSLTMLIISCFFSWQPLPHGRPERKW